MCPAPQDGLVSADGPGAFNSILSCAHQCSRSGSESCGQRLSDEELISKMALSEEFVGINLRPLFLCVRLVSVPMCKEMDRTLPEPLGSFLPGRRSADLCPVCAAPALRRETGPEITG